MVETTPHSEHHPEESKTRYELDQEEAHTPQEKREASVVQLISEITPLKPLLEGVVSGRFPYEKLREKLAIRQQKVEEFLQRLQLLSEHPVFLIEDESTPVQSRFQQRVRSLQIYSLLIPVYQNLLTVNTSETEKADDQEVLNSLITNLEKVRTEIQADFEAFGKIQLERLEESKFRIEKAKGLAFVTQAEQNLRKEAFFQNIQDYFGDTDLGKQILESWKALLAVMAEKINQLKLLERTSQKSNAKTKDVFDA